VVCLSLETIFVLELMQCLLVWLLETLNPTSIVLQGICQLEWDEWCLLYSTHICIFHGVGHYCCGGYVGSSRRRKDHRLREVWTRRLLCESTAAGEREPLRPTRRHLTLANSTTDHSYSHWNSLCSLNTYALHDGNNRTSKRRLFINIYLLIGGKVT